MTQLVADQELCKETIEPGSSVLYEIGPLKAGCYEIRISYRSIVRPLDEAKLMNHRIPPSSQCI